jgi:protein-S-isoprenylcysteine O-methyltransferase Ste14
MGSLIWRAFGGLLFLLVVLAVALFLPAGTLGYWQAWVFLAVFGLSVLAITLYLLRRDPQLLERRTSAGPIAEKELRQRLIQSLASLAFVALFVVCAVDHRLSWSAVPPAVVVLGDVLVALGLLAVFRVFKENTFTSATIEVGAEQRVISTGPYALVRHPMYAGALIMLLGVPLALGAWWGLLLVVAMAAVIVWRLFDEEKFLVKNLPGYPEYQRQVRYRLLPLVW